jgi:hypothetical protein
MDVSVNIPGFKNEIFDKIQAYSNNPKEYLYYTKFQNDLLPICNPQQPGIGTGPGRLIQFIMPNTLKFLYYIRLMQVYLFGEPEKSLNDEDILDVFQIYGDASQLVIGRAGDQVLIWQPTKTGKRGRITNISIFGTQDNLPQSPPSDDDIDL